MKESNKKGEISEGTSNKELSNKVIEAFLFILSGNPGLLKGDSLNKYIEYLIEVLPKVNYPLKNLNLTGLFYRTKYHKYLNDINL